MKYQNKFQFSLKISVLLLVVMGWPIPQSFGQGNLKITDNAHVIRAVLNGTEYGFNAETGCLESMIHPVAGCLLAGYGKGAGLIDMAFPLGSFEILRVSSKYSKGAKITVSDGKVEIRYEELGQNFPSYFPAPRANMLIESNPMDVKHCFADNLYMCPFPSKPGGVNGSARYSERPELSAALKQCATLRKQFLPYFTDGTLIGDCVLTRECKDAHISAYRLGEKLLIIVLRDSDEKNRKKKINFEYDVSCWLGSGAVTMKMYDSYGKQGAEKKGKVKGRLTYDMQYGEFSFVEIALSHNKK